LQDDCPVAFVFGVAVFFTHCYRAASGLLSFVVVDVAYRACPLCRFVKCMSTVCVNRDRVMMLYPSGCLNPITLHITRLCLRVAPTLSTLPFVLQVLCALV